METSMLLHFPHFREHATGDAKAPVYTPVVLVDQVAVLTLIEVLRNG